MPIFEYACPHCGHVFEKLLLTRQAQPPDCPQCGWKRVEQKFSTFATAKPMVKCGADSCAVAGGG